MPHGDLMKSDSDNRSMKTKSKTWRILNLGAGVQSTTVYLLAMDGEIPAIDVAIFADTQEEPKAVYEHLKWLQSLGGPPILVRSTGKLGNDLARGIHSTGQRFASIPAYTAPDHNSPRSACSFGITRRQCTSEYKIKVVENTIRRELFEVKFRGRVPKDVRAVQLFGISLDERIRSMKIKKRFEDVYWSEPDFPLLEEGRRWRRDQCQQYLRDRVPHKVPRSACVFCPYHSDREWMDLKTNDPEGWARAVEVDNSLRVEGSVVNRSLNQKLYVHGQCIPLEMVKLEPDKKRQEGFFKFYCDEGMCGV